MRKIRKPFLLILLMAIVGIVLAITYEAPEFKIFLFSQNLDEEVVNSELKIEKSREEILNHLQVIIAELILEGQTYDQDTNLSNHFIAFEESYQSLREYVEKVIPSMNKVIQNADFDRMIKVVNSLAKDDQPLGREMLSLQQSRMNYLLELNKKLEHLSELLSEFEGMFYTTDRPSQPILYFQSIVNIFEEIETIHNDYVTATESYHRAKTNYYLILVDMGLKDYFLGR